MINQPKLNVLPKIPVPEYTGFLYGSPIQKIELFFNQFKLLQYKKRSLVLQAEDNLSSVFYIKSGFLRAYKISEQGEELTLAILKPGDIFPLALGVDNFSNNYYLEALLPVELWKVPQEIFYNFIKENMDVAGELTNRAMAKVGGLLTRMEYLVFGTAYSKVASILLICAKQFGEKKDVGLIITLPLTHKDIATLVGITRETACLEMRKLEKDHIVSHQGRLVVVKDLSRLEDESLLNEADDKLLGNSL